MTEKKSLTTDQLAVGYGKSILISDIKLEVKPGDILTLIGPNGSGKSTILKTISGQLKAMGGSISIVGKEMSRLKEADMATALSLVSTERIRAELMSCREIIATGRYPYTGHLGILSKEDWRLVDKAIEKLRLKEIADRDFNKISDGQRQRVMLARAICQDTDIVVLDEPTSFLDIGYKLDILKSVKAMAKEENKAIIMSLHELDLAMQISDTIVCVDGDKISKVASPKEVFSGDYIQKLFGVNEDEFDPLTGRIFLRC